MIDSIPARDEALDLFRRQGIHSVYDRFLGAQRRFALALLPPHMHEAVGLYVIFGLQPGGFLTAVVTNDLKGAVLRADDENLQRLVDYVRFFYNHAPSDCWGSIEKVAEWCDQGGLVGRSEE